MLSYVFVLVVIAAVVVGFRWERRRPWLAGLARNDAELVAVVEAVDDNASADEIAEAIGEHLTHRQLPERSGE